jgi:hypothetical protein
MENRVDVVTDIVCPFYHAEMGLKLRCEGFCEAVTIQLSFLGKEQMQIHKHQHCMNIRGYRRCPIYPVINKQYEED